MQWVARRGRDLELMGFYPLTAREVEQLLQVAGKPDVDCSS